MGGLRRVLWVMIIISLILAIYPAVRRWAVEGEMQEVKLVFDDQGLAQLAYEENIPLNLVLEELQTGYLDSIALSPLTPKKMFDRGMLSLFLIAPSQSRFLTPYDLGSGSMEGFLGYYVFIPCAEDREFFLSTLALDFHPFQPADWDNKDSFLVAYDKKVNFITSPLDFAPEDIKIFKESGWDIVLRPHVEQDRGRLSPAELLDSFPDSQTVIFSGSEVWGYPDDIARTAEILENRDMVLGFIEPFLAHQRGIRELGIMVQDRLVRVHSIQQGEMDKLSPERIINRYIRAVEERNARLLYMRPVLVGETPLENNKFLIGQLIEKLQERGYSVGSAPFMNPLQLAKWEILILSMGVGALGLLMLTYLIKMQWQWYCIVGGLGFFTALILIFSGYPEFVVQLGMLTAAIVIPVIPFLLLLEKSSGNYHPWGWLLVSAGTMIGVILIIGLASDRAYLLGLEYFQGVKISLILPLTLLAIYIFHWQLDILAGSGREWRKIMRKILQFPLILILGALALALFFYINRSGNIPLLPVPEWEIAFREFLERVFLVRPRFKEFLWGHPFLILGLFLWQEKRFPLLAGMFLLLGCMGQITMVNSFIHFHTPLWVSLWRTFIGLMLGGVLGYALILGSRLSGILPGRQKE